MGFFSQYLVDYIDKIQEENKIEINKQRCIALGCVCSDKCITLCPQRAISNGTKHIDDSKCSKCGTCITNCINGAIQFTVSKDYTLIKNIINKSKEVGFISFKCNNSKFQNNNQHAINVDCLSRLYPALILAPFSVGVESIWLDISGCNNCAKNSKNLVMKNIETNYSESAEWLKRLGINKLKIILDSTLALEILPNKDGQTNEQSNIDRRGFFKNIGKGAKSKATGAIGEFAQVVLEQEKNKSKKPFINAQEPPEHRLLLLQILKNLSKKQPLQENIPLFDKLKIGDNCNFCNICSRLCTTGAITSNRNKESGVETINYIPAYCLGCRKCELVCSKQSITFEGKVDIKTFLSKEQLVIKENNIIDIT